ncbi:MAG: MipA/OmpV family protein [Congregibacter sp.]|nr:MipA/OmpV family protein [Congregibacter sp.]
MTLAQGQVQGAAQTPSAPLAVARGKLGWQTQLGIGLIVNPESVGGEDYNATPIPFFDFRYLDERGTKYFANVPQGLGGFFYRSRNSQNSTFLNIGAGIAPGFNVRDDSIPGVDEIGISTEARLYLEAGGEKWSANAALAQDVGSGHEGAYLDLSLARRGSLGQRGFYLVGPVLRLGDDTYKAAFFNVDAPQNTNAGLADAQLPSYSADGGLERIGVQGLLSLPLGQSRWRWTSILRASQLMGDAADSPIVTDETQFFFLTSVTRSF